MPLTKLMAADVACVGPLWSPDGCKMAFLSTRALDGSDSLNANGTKSIWLMNADGSAATPLTKLTAVGASSDFPKLP